MEKHRSKKKVLLVHKGEYMEVLERKSDTVTVKRHCRKEDYPDAKVLLMP